MITPRNSKQIRQLNMRTLLSAIKQNGPISKRDLQKITGLSWGAVSSLTSALYDNGYVIYSGKQVTNVGRKPSELDINKNNNYIIGVDLNLSGISCVVTDLKGRIVHEFIRFLTHLKFECVMETLLSLIDEVISDTIPGKNILGIGLAVQGTVDVERGVSVYFPYIEGWKDVPLQQILEEKYSIPTYLMHDPHCIMIAERALEDSVVDGAEHAVLLRIDYGIGMSLLTNGQLYLGSNGKSGEFGHICMNPDGPVCSCGNRGCLEEYASGNGLVRRFIEKINQGVNTKVDINNIANISYRVLGQAALDGDELCIQLFRQMGEYLGLSLSFIYNMLDPDLVVLYGDLTAFRTLYEDVLEEKLHEHVYSGIPVKFRFSKLGRNAAAVGVALVVSEYIVQELDIPIAEKSDMETD